jgi:hypothetical protein
MLSGAASLSLSSGIVGSHGTSQTKTNSHLQPCGNDIVQHCSSLLVSVEQDVFSQSASLTLRFCCAAESVCHGRISAHQRDLGAREEGRDDPTSAPSFETVWRFFPSLRVFRWRVAVLVSRRCRNETLRARLLVIRCLAWHRVDSAELKVLKVGSVKGQRIGRKWTLRVSGHLPVQWFTQLNVEVT